MNQVQEKYLCTASEAIKAYCTPVVDPNDSNPGVGSGTFVIIGQKKGLISNEHVLETKRAKRKDICIPMPDYSLKLLKIKNAYALEDKKEYFKGVDMAFVELSDESVDDLSKIGKKFWDMDQHESIINQYDFLSKDSESAAFVIWGNVDEGKKQIQEGNRDIWYYENAGLYGVIVDLTNKDYHTKCEYKGLRHEIEIDILVSPINTGDRVPEAFYGMSGGALWKVMFDQNGKVYQIYFVGIATEQPDKKQLISRGPIALYKGFYPYCIREMQAKNIKAF